MKFRLKILFILLLFPVFVYGASPTMQTDAEVITPISITLNEHMVMPSVYTNTAGNISSADLSLVPGGEDGNHAVFSITGEPDHRYALVFTDFTTISNAGKNLNVTVFVVSGSKTGRTLDHSGNDSVGLRGNVFLPGNQTEGTYSNASKPLAVTVVYE
ncbi:MAG: DUF4402 domain-containing protein [Pseudomonadota bacterium]